MQKLAVTQPDQKSKKKRKSRKKSTDIRRDIPPMMIGGLRGLVHNGLYTGTSNQLQTPPPPLPAGPLAPLYSSKDFDYGYRPPGFGLAVSGSLSAIRTPSPCVCRCRNEKSAEAVVEGPYSSREQAGMDAAALSMKIDKISVIVFPVLFLIFNIFYWSYYVGF